MQHHAPPRPVAALFLLPIVLPILFLVLIGGQSTIPPEQCAGPADLGKSAAAEKELDEEPLRVAAEIVAAVRAFGPTADKPHAAVIALATARQESGIRNLDYGDRDSLGAFQQRPSQGWGTPEEVRNVAHATTTFLQRLVQVPGWETIRVTDAAATVQRPAAQYRGHYQRWVPLATSLTHRFWNGATSAVPASAPRSDPCQRVSMVASGSVVYPVPPHLVGTNRGNWGGHGRPWSRWHTGTDFSVPCGTPVLAATSGAIEIDHTQSWAGPWLVKVTTGPDALSTWYAHMRSIDVTAGQTVTAGQRLGQAGDLGNTTGCHLHFEVHTKNGSIYGPDNVNPTPWLAHNVGKNPGRGHGSFVIATFNALGHSHTAPGGDKQGWADSGTRTRRMADLLARQAPDIVGLQEFQGPQARVFGQVTGTTWGTFGNRDNVIIWRRHTFDVVAKASVAIPYFEGNTRQMPLVRLRHLPSSRIVTVINVHNPANVHGPAARWRADAIARERSAVARERAAGYPVILVGDLNDRAPAFCAVTKDSLMLSASGGSHLGRCLPPSRMGIDWILGTGLTFTGFTVDPSPRGNASDPPFVEAIANPDPAP